MSNKQREVLDRLIECAIELGATQAKKAYGCYDAIDGKLELALHVSVAKHIKALAEPIVGTKMWYEDGKIFTQNLTAVDVYKETVCIVQTHGNWYYSKHDDENACGYCHVREQFKSSKPCKPRLEPAPKPREWQELCEYEKIAVCNAADKAIGADKNLSWRMALIDQTNSALRAKNGVTR